MTMDLRFALSLLKIQLRLVTSIALGSEVSSRCFNRVFCSKVDSRDFFLNFTLLRSMMEAFAEDESSASGYML